MDCNPDGDYEGLESDNEQVAQEEKEEEPDEEYENMMISCAGTFHQRMMPHEV